MLSSKLALVTGAASGIGRATCMAFAKEGAKVIAVDLNKTALESVIKSLNGTENSAFEMDVSNSENVTKVAKQVLELYHQPPSIIVNSAGITKDDFIINMKEENFDKVIDVNLKGTYLVMQTFGKLLIDHNLKGSIINMGSIIGKIGNMGQVNYAASKAGVELMTKTAAKEFGRYGVRCNVILPGFIETPMVETVPDKVKNMFAKQISLGRLGKPEGLNMRWLKLSCSLHLTRVHMLMVPALKSQVVDFNIRKALTKDATHLEIKDLEGIVE